MGTMKHEFLLFTETSIDLIRTGSSSLTTMRSLFLNFLLLLWHVIKNFPNFSVKLKRCKLRKLNPTLSMICLPRCFVTDNIASLAPNHFYSV